MPATSQHWAELIDPVLNRQFFYVGFGGEGRRASMLSTLFGMQASQYAEEKEMGLGGFSTSGWNFEDSGRVLYDERVKGYETTFSHHEFAKGFIVQRKLMDDNRLAGVMRSAAELGDTAFRMREKAGAKVFGNAFSAATSSTLDDYGTDSVGADLVALCSDAHPAPAGAAGSNQANEGVLSLTAANVGTTRTAMTQFKDYQGDFLNVMPDMLLVPPELEDTALTIVRSINDPASANNAINPQSGRFQVVVWHYLTDTNAWFMIDSGMMRRNLLWFDRIPLEFGREVDFDTFQAKFRAYMRFSLGWIDWRWVYGQNPS